MTDELSAYKSLGNTFNHQSIRHSAEEWTRGNIHTNNVESAWSLFKTFSCRFLSSDQREAYGRLP